MNGSKAERVQKSYCNDQRIDTGKDRQDIDGVR